MQTNALIVFVKNPKLGAVKTRLAATIGDEKALSVYKQLIALTEKATDSQAFDTIVFYSDFVDEAIFPSAKHRLVQIQGDLGLKIKAAFADTFALGYEKVCIIGTDCAMLKTDILKSAFQYLESKDTVLGPTFDGGYYLIGMKNFYPALFDNIEWSTSKVAEETQKAITKAGLSNDLLPQLHDVDFEEDLVTANAYLAFSGKKIVY